MSKRIGSTTTAAFAGAILCGLLGLQGLAFGQAYPSRLIEFITPYPPGGISDTSFRVIEPFLGKELGVSVVNINKAGAGGQIAAEYCARAQPDGYTVFNGANVIFTTARALRNEKVGVTIDAFVAIGSYTVDPTVLVVSKDSPFKTMKELIAYAKANPGKLSAGDGGSGGAGHFMLEALKIIFGLDIATVHFQGAGILLQQVMGGHIDMVLAGASTFLPSIKSGQTIAIAVTIKHPDLPGVPTLSELNAADAAFDASQAFYVPKQTPQAVVHTLSSALAKVMSNPQATRAVSTAGLLPRYVDGAGTTAAIENDYRQAAKITQKLDLGGK